MRIRSEMSGIGKTLLDKIKVEIRSNYARQNDTG